jgi:hypothetical protein
MYANPGVNEDTVRCLVNKQQFVNVYALGCEARGCGALAITAAGDRLVRANASAIEAYNSVLWRGRDAMHLLPELVWLLNVAIVGTTLALLVSRFRL